mmetsp:Transcript_8446/g.17788  ORF Transcript_8446/g.17788 Transcript_8446/m.17788 type:complete len:146 (-) Transcript_8446:193-630(-)
MGVIGTKDDEHVNAALVNAIRGAKRADQESEIIKRFVMIGNPRRVRRLSKKLPFLKGYANGKEEAESALRQYFHERGCIIKVRCCPNIQQSCHGCGTSLLSPAVSYYFSSSFTFHRRKIQAVMIIFQNSETVSFLATSFSGCRHF